LLAPAHPPGGQTELAGDVCRSPAAGQVVDDPPVPHGQRGKPLRKIDPENRQFWVMFDFPVKYDYSDIEELVLAYAITIHKSQGAEYPAVICPITTHHYIMLQRNLIYTAITRAKELVVLIGTKNALAIAIGNNRVKERYTSLRKFLANFREKSTA